MKNKLISILVSVAVALGMWLYVITVERTETEQTFYIWKAQAFWRSGDSW